MIARFAASTRPEARPRPDGATARLAGLVSPRRQIVALIVAERQRRKRVADRRLQKSIGPFHGEAPPAVMIGWPFPAGTRMRAPHDHARTPAHRARILTSVGQVGCAPAPVMRRMR
jgi:hypothetical protein